jgi:hypothetical protein
MLSEDVKEKGFVLLCCGRPLGDCTVKTVDEARGALACRASLADAGALTGGAAAVPDAIWRSMSSDSDELSLCYLSLLVPLLGQPLSLFRCL